MIKANLLIIVLVCIFFTSISNAREFSIMAYNVENLFDVIDDPGHDDETYLPLELKKTFTHKKKCQRLTNFKFKKDCFHLNWNLQTVQRKMKNLAEVILSVEAGKGPDILILAEVENINILKQLNKNYLQEAKYKTIELIPGQDPRGINVAILSRFKKHQKSELISLNLIDDKKQRQLKTRGLLRVPLKVSEKIILTVFAAHLPSQASSSDVRRQAIAEINKIVKAENNIWVVGGDFNITEQEENKHQLISKDLNRNGFVSHQLGCSLCQGTHFYKSKWSFLDLFYFDFRLKKQGVQVLIDSIQVINTHHFIGTIKKPMRFDPDKGQGASDHFPIFTRLRF